MARLFYFEVQICVWYTECWIWEMYSMHVWMEVGMHLIAVIVAIAPLVRDYASLFLSYTADLLLFSSLSLWLKKIVYKPIEM